MFLGEYKHSVDEKGRIVLPRKFRDDLTKGCVITKGQDRCLYVFPPGHWQQHAEQVTALSRLDKNARAYARAFFSGSSEQSPDRQGRIALPEILRSYASIDRDVRIVGVGERIEIWSEAAWSGIADELDTAYADIQESLTGEGI